MHPIEPARILHLEDDPSWHREVKLALGEQYELRWAITPQEASNLLDKIDFDLVIVDIDLVSGSGRDEKGFQFVEELRRWKILPTHRVIILSGYAHLEERTRRAFRDYGVFDVIPKDSFDPDELAYEVSEALRV